jgi:hypothetical protein
MKRALTPRKILSKEYETLELSEPWQKAFGKPEKTGVWAICGHSGNGKSSLVMQLMKELSISLGKGHMNSYEEDVRLTMKNLLSIAGMDSARITLIRESFTDFYQRAKKPKSPKFFVLDSVQAMRMTAKQYEMIKELAESKLVIMVLRADGKRPKGNLATDIWYDAELKIWVEGYVATSNGRHNPGGRYVVWKEKAIEYHGTQSIEKI